MAEHLLDHLHVGAGRDREAGGRVPQLVRMHARNVDGLRGGSECGAEGTHAQRSASADAGEHEVVGVLASDVPSQLLR
ncbi:MAG TPA: hypothetical protein VFL69_14515 [Marmoricola sp.]|nr:hypothetical protein [Marmoricola sp.]